MVQMFSSRTLFSESYFLFLKLKGGTGFAKGTILFLNLCAKLSVVKKKIEVSEGLKTNLRLKEVLMTAKVVVSSF